MASSENIRYYLNIDCCLQILAHDVLHNMICIFLRTFTFSLISVFVRVRPLSSSEKEHGNAWKVDGNSITQVDVASGNAATDMPPYMLDNVFSGDSTTEHVYKSTAQSLIGQVIEGFNSTVFAYGQTSSGKTHTMRGTENDPGIIPRAVTEIFDLINENKDREFLVRMSYMEVRPIIIAFPPG